MSESRKSVFCETAVLAVIEAVLCAIMVGVFALLGKFAMDVLWGALAGFFLTVANYFVLAVGVNLAADKAQNQDVNGGKNLLRMSMLLRYVVLAVLLFALAKSGLCNILAMGLPLIFFRPALMLGEFFRKKG